MKTAVIFLGLFVIIAMANKAELSKQLGESIKKCIITLKPDKESLNNFMTFKNYNNQKVSCLAACALKGFGVLQNAKIDSAKTVDLLQKMFEFSEEKVQKITSHVTDCKNKAEMFEDDCAVAGAFGECFKPLVNVKVNYHTD